MCLCGGVNPDRSIHRSIDRPIQPPSNTHTHTHIPPSPLKQSLGVSGYGAPLIEHALLQAGLDPLRKLLCPLPPAPDGDKEGSKPAPPVPTPDGKEGKGEGRGVAVALSPAEAARLAEALQGLEGVMAALDVPGQVGMCHVCMYGVRWWIVNVKSVGWICVCLCDGGVGRARAGGWGCVMFVCI